MSWRLSIKEKGSYRVAGVFEHFPAAHSAALQESSPDVDEICLSRIREDGWDAAMGRLQEQADKLGVDLDEMPEV